MSVKVYRQQQLSRKLARIAKATENEVAPAIRDAAMAIHADAVQRVPKDTGELARSIEFKTGNGGLTAIIGPSAKSAAVVKTQRGGSAFATRKLGAKPLSELTKYKLWLFFIGYWTEFGTKGYEVKAGGKKGKTGKKVLSDGTTFFGKKVNIPAKPAQPFMRPAWDVNKTWAVDRVAKAVNDMIGKASGL